jgi:hypothetical protein
MRGALTGLYLPREDLLGWKIEISSEIYTHDDPGPISEAEVSLDAVGCLLSGRISLKAPRHPIFPAYRFTALLWLLSRTHGWVDVGVGFIPPARQDGREEWTLELRPNEELDIDGYFDGRLLGGHNTLGADAGGWNETNQTVVSRILERFPTAMLGTYSDGTVVLARPEDGSPVNVSQANFYDFKSTGLVTLPYATESRWDGGPGWSKGQHNGISRPPLTPRKAVDAGSVTFVETVLPSGPPLIREEELTIGEVGEATVSTAAVTGLIKRKVTAEQYAYVRVYDLEAWYEGSALPGQDNELVKSLRLAVSNAQGAFALSHDTLGPDAALTRLEQQRLQSAEAQLRVARVGQGSIQSTYEPLTAKISLGFVLEGFSSIDYPAALYATDRGDSLLTGTSMWISRSPWDPEAIGQRSDPDNPDASDLIHPMISADTIKLFDTPLDELTFDARNTPFQQGSLEIPANYFRGPMAPALASIMDQQWRESFDPDEPPQDAEPPSASWNGKWYFYVASWWRVAAPS